MKLIRYTITLVVFITSLFIGYRAGDGAGLNFFNQKLREAARLSAAAQSPLAGTIAKSAPASATFLNGQRSLLIIGTDDLEAASPRLESVWLVLLIPPEPHLTLIPIYPFYPGGAGNQSSHLEKVFGINKTGECLHACRSISVEFLQELREQDIWWSDYLVIDRHSWQTAMDFLSSESASGNAVLTDIQPGSAEGLDVYFEKLSMLDGNPREAVVAQADLYQELCWAGMRTAASRFDFLSGSAVLLDQLSDRLISSARPQEIVASLKGLAWSTGLSCEFPTLSQEISK